MHSAAASQRVDRLIGTVSVIVGFAFATWGFITAAPNIDEHPNSVFFLLLVCMWMAAPYLVMAAAAVTLCTGFGSRLVLAGAMAGCTVFGIWAFDLVDEDAQGGLVLLFAPFYQLMAVICVTFVIVVVESRRRTRY